MRLEKTVANPQSDERSPESARTRGKDLEPTAPDQPRSVFDRFAEPSSHFVLVALLQNSERRSDLAAHRKLDAIAEGLADLMQHGVDPGGPDLGARAGELRRAVALVDRG